MGQALNNNNMKLFSSLVIAAAISAMAVSCSKTEITSTVDNTAQVVLDNIMTRTSIRQFTDRQIAPDTLENIVRAGMAAPSAINLQPWAFVVVTDRDMLDSLEAVHPHSNLKTATAAIIVCGNLEKAGKDFVSEYWIQDCSAATENILLAAHAYGLGAVWCGVYPNPNVQPEVARVLELPESIIPLNIVTMGYPATDSEPKDKWNAENVHYQKW